MLISSNLKREDLCALPWKPVEMSNGISLWVWDYKKQVKLYG